MLVCVFLGRTCTRDRGCAVHPAFPRILCLKGREIKGKPRATLAARSRTYVSTLFPRAMTLPGPAQTAAAFARAQPTLAATSAPPGLCADGAGLQNFVLGLRSRNLRHKGCRHERN